ncbi:MAG: carbohydrate deacetylase [Aristaeellaceae bacterium]
MKFIINADDFGHSPKENAAIVQCFADGVIDRTTILVNMPDTRAACALAQEHGFFDKVGLHINLVEGRPLTERCRQDRILCGPDGNFLGQFYLGYLRRFILPRRTRQAIREEVRAQIEAYLDMGFPLMHADSHRYIHTYYSCTRVILPLLKRYGFRSVRISRNLTGKELSIPFAVYKRIINQKMMLMHAFKLTDFMGSLEDWENYPHKEREGICELMVHPTFCGDVLFDGTLPHPSPFLTESELNKRGIYHGEAQNAKEARAGAVCT